MFLENPELSSFELSVLMIFQYDALNETQSLIGIEKLNYQTFNTVDLDRNHCSNARFPKHINQWFNISLTETRNLLESSDDDRYLAAMFIENECGSNMNLQFTSFNMWPLIDGQYYSNDGKCLMQPWRNFVAIKQITFDETNYPANSLEGVSN